MLTIVLIILAAIFMLLWLHERDRRRHLIRILDTSTYLSHDRVTDFIEAVEAGDTEVIQELCDYLKAARC